MSRYNMYKLNTLNGVVEHDILGTVFDIRDFSEVIDYQVSIGLSGRPDLISIELYNTPEYWNILMEINGICDAWNDLVPGMILKVPTNNSISKIARTYGAK